MNEWEQWAKKVMGLGLDKIGVAAIVFVLCRINY
jgi:hypothetical protein